MNEALRTVELPAEAIALIKEGAARPKAESSLLTLSASNGIRSESTTDTAVAQTAKPRIAREPEPVYAAANAAITVRVPAEIPARLLRASTDRKLRRVRPCTQQEMVTEAVSQWLKRNGY